MADFTYYPLPHDTAKAFQGYGAGRCNNPGLFFDRFLPDLGKVKRKEEVGERKRAALERVAGCRPDGRLLSGYCNRWRAVAAAVGATVFEAASQWRVVVGLGGKGPLEVGFTFHRLYGFPIIPGSALKGLARGWALVEKGGNERDEELVAVFGREPDRGKRGDGGSAGRAIFLDAIPSSNPTLELDIMNPHYPDYYRGEAEPPTDWQSPNPVYFLAVAPHTPFLFAVGWRGDVRRELQSMAVQWLREGLTRMGVGAKTASGYGYFVPVPVAAPGPGQGRAGGMREPAEIPWRRAVVRVHRSGQGGTLVDVETRQVITFWSGAEEPRGITFKTKEEVEYRAVEREGRLEAISVRRMPQGEGGGNG